MEGYISPRAKIGDGAYIDGSARILGPAIIGKRTFIDGNVVIGNPYSGEIERFMDQSPEATLDMEHLDRAIQKPTIIGAGSRIGRGSIISAGSQLGVDCNLEFDTFVGTDTKIGANARMVYRAQVYDGVVVRNGCIIGGFVGDSSRLGNRVRMLGSLIHKHKVPLVGRPGWNDLREPGPVVGDDAIIGFNATVIGEVLIGRGAYVLAGAVVTKEVADEDIVAGVPAVSIKEKVSPG